MKFLPFREGYYIDGSLSGLSEHDKPINFFTINSVKEDMKMPKITTFGKTAKEDEIEQIVGNPTTPPTTTEGVLKALEVILDAIPREPIKE